ncbi:MAG: hypothetical protein V3U84_07505 [Thiotrichaceae bacterium]
MLSIVIEIAGLTNDDDGIAQNQIAGPGNLNLNGALVVDGVAIAVEAQQVVLTSASNLSTVNFTITGTDADGKTFSETIIGPNNTNVKTASYFKTVTQIFASASLGTGVKVGWVAANGGITKSISVNSRQSPFNMSVSAQEIVSGGTVSVQHTVDDPQATHIGRFATDANWLDTLNITDVTETSESNIAFPVQAVRGIVTIGTSATSWIFTFLQGQNG